MSLEGMRLKARRVMDIMEERLAGLGGAWEDVTDVNVYTAAANGDWLAAELLPRMGPDACHGIRWHLSHPPIIGLDFEMDLRGIRRRVWLTP